MNSRLNISNASILVVVVLALVGCKPSYTEVIPVISDGSYFLHPAHGRGQPTIAPGTPFLKVDGRSATLLGYEGELRRITDRESRVYYLVETYVLDRIGALHRIGNRTYVRLITENNRLYIRKKNGDQIQLVKV